MPANIRNASHTEGDHVRIRWLSHSAFEVEVREGEKITLRELRKERDSLEQKITVKDIEREVKAIEEEKEEVLGRTRELEGEIKTLKAKLTEYEKDI